MKCLWLVLVFFAFEPHLALMQETSRSASLQEQILPGIQSMRNTVEHIALTFQHNMEKVKDTLQLPLATVQHAKLFEGWISTHSGLFGHCYAEQGLSTTIRDEMNSKIASTLSLSSGSKAQIRELVAKVPILSMLSYHFQTRPDWAYTILNILNAIPETRKIISLVKTMNRAEDQELIQLEGYSLQETVGASSGTVVQVVGSVAGGASSQPFIDSSATSSGAPGGLGLSDSVFVAGSSVLDTLQGAFLPSSTTSLGAVETFQGSSGTSSGMAMSVPTTIMGSSGKGSDVFASLIEIEGSSPSSQSSPSSTSEDSSYTSGLEGSDSTSSASLASVGFSQTSSFPQPDRFSPAAAGAEPKHQPPAASGCCLGLTFMIILLGIGLGAEYYIHNMHKLNPCNYEEHLESSVVNQINQLKEYLASNPERAKQLEDRLKKDPEDLTPSEKNDHILKLPLDFTKIFADKSLQHQLSVESGTKSKVDVDSSDSNQQPVVVEDDSSGNDEQGLNMVPKQETKPVTSDVPQKSQSPLTIAEVKPMCDKDTLAKVLGFFYMGYNSVPNFAISKTFGYYAIMFGVALVLSIAAQGHTQ